MRIRRMIVDKILGVVALVISSVFCVLTTRLARVVVQGTSLPVRAASGLGALLGAFVCAAGLFVGYFLLRYPPERQSTAADIGRAADRQGGPLTPPWREH